MVLVSGGPSFVRQLWGGGINRDRKEVLMSVGVNTVSSWLAYVRWQPQNHLRQNLYIRNYPSNDNKLQQTHKIINNV